MGEAMQRRWREVRAATRGVRVKTCCCLAPLRPGLLALAYFLVAFNAIVVMGTAAGGTLLEPPIARVQRGLFEDAPSAAVCVLPPALDLAAAVVLLVAIHRRDRVLLQWYVYYGVASLAATMLLYSLVLPMLAGFNIAEIVATTLCQMFVMLLVRSLIVDMKMSEIGARSSLHYDKRSGVASLRDTSYEVAGVACHRDTSHEVAGVAYPRDTPLEVVVVPRSPTPAGGDNRESPVIPVSEASVLPQRPQVESSAPVAPATTVPVTSVPITVTTLPVSITHSPITVTTSPVSVTTTPTSVTTPVSSPALSSTVTSAPTTPAAELRNKFLMKYLSSTSHSSPPPPATPDNPPPASDVATTSDVNTTTTTQSETQADNELNKKKKKRGFFRRTPKDTDDSKKNDENVVKP